MNRTIRALPIAAPVVVALLWFGQWQLAVVTTAGLIIAAAVGGVVAERRRSRA